MPMALSIARVMHFSAFITSMIAYMRGDYTELRCSMGYARATGGGGVQSFEVDNTYEYRAGTPLHTLIRACAIQLMYLT